MRETDEQLGRAVVFQDAQGVLSWMELGNDNEAHSIIAAREKQGFRVFTITTRGEAKSLVNPPISQDEDSFLFRRQDTLFYTVSFRHKGGVE